MKRRALTWLIFLALPAFAAPEDAVVRVASHGASATVIYTEPGRSLILGCAHAYEGGSRSKKHTIDVPSPTGALAGRTGLISGNDSHSQQELNAGKKSAQARVLNVDYRSDLSLIELPVGPLPYVCPVAPPGFQPSRHIISCGYDRMDLQPGRARTWPATILTVEGNRTYTREKPWHGRSGGALIDKDAGLLIGVTHGYEVSPGSRGIFVSHAAICGFLQKSGWPAPQQPLQNLQQPFQQMQQPLQSIRQAPQQTFPIPGQAPYVRGRVEIPQEHRVPNRTGSQCVWVSLATLCRYHGVARGAELTRHGGLAGPGQPEGELKRLNIRHQSQHPGSRNAAILRDAIDRNLGAMVGLGGKHAVVAVELSGDRLTVIENCDPKLGTRTVALSQWDGWTIVVYPDGSDGAAQTAPRAAPRPRPQQQPGGC